MYITYDHHGNMVTVDSKLKGLHRQYCLCYDCEKFNPEDRDKNCPIANELFEFCKKHGVVTPVWECKSSDFKEKIIVAI
jgi:hypothetical protein